MKLQIVQIEIEIEICQLRDFVIINAVDILFISVSVCLSDCLPLPLSFSLTRVWAAACFGECSASKSERHLPRPPPPLPARNHYNNNSKNHFT